ncbi:NIF family HAD-type phosphatase [Chamaesiphon sp. VAR_69_metabat_338]|uniref:NIF family HAD-type phosphatase n=1 Tax=Chamaesiphon sp. VAR_69_metabat_338 TaxID=2964704 RepID=UPI0037C18923
MVRSKDKLLILDLDETLVRATEQPLMLRSDFSVYTYHVYKRPYLDTFLTTCLDWFDVAVWTSSGAEYATKVVDKIFPDPQALAFVWASDRCSIAYNYNYDRIDRDYPPYYSRKPLKKVKRRGYNLESVIAIDDTPKKWEKSYGNLIEIRPFEGDESDRELEYLLIYLDTLKNEKNIRSVEKRGWREKIIK